MDINEVVNKFLESPKRMDMGAGKLSKRWKCSREDIYNARKIARLKINTGKRGRLPKILVFDIETSPLMAFVWQTSVWNARVSEDKIISEWFMLTWAAKWLFSNEVMSDKLTGKEALKEDDKRITTSLWKLLDEADIVIAHNGDKFDVPNLNTRFIVNNLLPPKPYQSIDTLKIARRQFGFTHNNLNAMARVFGMEGKKQTDFTLWKECLDGDDKALAYMEDYNRQDVLVLEEVYMKLRPWIKGHPNLALYLEADRFVCPNCGEDHLTSAGHYYTNVGRYQILQCDSCGAMSRMRSTNVPKEIRPFVLNGNLR